MIDLNETSSRRRRLSWTNADMLIPLFASATLRFRPYVSLLIGDALSQFAKLFR